MVKIGLMIKATLTNIDKFYPWDSRNFSWPLKVRCTGCGEENQNWHLISLSEVIELSNGKANFLYKCKCCSRENHLTILPSNYVDNKPEHQKKNLVTLYSDEDEEKFKTIISFDCRGLELVDFQPRDGWAAESGKKVFCDIDLSDKEWCEFNEIDNVPVEIGNFEHKFITLK